MSVSFVPDVYGVVNHSVVCALYRKAYSRDEDITGTQAKKRPESLKMIKLCRQRKIDLILTKSLSRFARNTVDSLNYIRELKVLGIAVIFEQSGKKPPL